MTIDLLKKFCSKDRWRYQLHNPFSQGGWTFATNGHIGIRVPLIPEIPGVEGAPDCFVLFEKHWRETPEHIWVDVPEPVKGHIDVKGPKGDVRLDSKYIVLCRELPNCQLALTGEESTTNDRPVLLKFHGGDGLLMPMRK